MDVGRSVQQAGLKKKGPDSGQRYSTEFKLEIVKKYLEESIPISIIVQECSVSAGTIRSWVRAYRSTGKAGLDHPFTNKKPTLPTPVKQKIVAIKEANPFFGIKRISQVLRRVFFLQASPETVRKTLHARSLISPPSKKRVKNVTRPRFFERSTPNQMWQTDIFTFRLGGHYAYLIGYIDDYSRYMTGLELFRSQTGQNVIEVYRRAASEYNPPKEMLTDQGRQYTSWRGSSRFEAELKKDKIHHIKSRPHHPMTLGKIERFWKTIYLEFLSRAQFESFEDAVERIRQWVKYYNHKRPHQGIGGLCPADRYFEIQTELRKTIEQGIQENLLEMALRGKPKLPFYMVGRMEGQSVVLRAEKGKLRLSVDDEDEKNIQEVIYNLNEKGESHGKDQGGEETTKQSLRGDGEMSGCIVGLDGAAAADRSMPGDVDTGDAVVSVAETGDGGDVASVGATGEPGEGAGTVTPVADDAGKETAHALNAGGTAEIGEIVNQGAGSEQNAESEPKQRSETGGTSEKS
jgi:transposase InsO family protein/transposase-like protein